MTASHTTYANANVSDGWVTDPTDVAGSDNSVGYDGYWFDYAGESDAGMTGLYIVRYRMFYPAFGRWLERGPAGDVDGANLYAFVKSKPVNPVDWSGMQSTPILTTAPSLDDLLDRLVCFPKVHDVETNV